MKPGSAVIEVMVKVRPTDQPILHTIELPPTGNFVKLCDGIHIRLLKSKEKA
jgi:hypothetical protein